MPDQLERMQNNTFKSNYSTLVQARKHLVQKTFLHAACIQLCATSLDIRFKPEAKPIFKKPRPVPFSILQDLFNSSPLPGQAKASIRVCGDYSVTVNSQLEDHRQPIPLPEDLMRKLGRGYCFSKIDLANAYNQICLSPDSQKKLALSTHKGVLLQK